MVAISAFQDAAGNLNPKEFNSSSAHESWAVTEDSPPRIRGQKLFTDSASSASQRLSGRNWFIGLKRELRFAAEHAWCAAVREDLAESGGEVLDEFGDNCGRHPKTVGRTTTGGAFFLKNKKSDLRQCVRILHSCRCRDGVHNAAPCHRSLRIPFERRCAQSNTPAFPAILFPSGC